MNEVGERKPTPLIFPLSFRSIDMKSVPPISASQPGGGPFDSSSSENDLENAIQNVKEVFCESIEPNFRNALRCNAPIAAMMIALSAIDCFASYYEGKDCGSSGYENFFKDYIQPLAPDGVAGYNPKVFHRNLRSGLVHNYVPTKTPASYFQKTDMIYVLIDDPKISDLHLTNIEGEKGKVVFHIESFFNHVKEAIYHYFGDLKNNETLAKNFLSWNRETYQLVGIDLSSIL